MDQPDAGSGRAPGHTETPQRPPRCPSSGKEATPGIEPAISHGSASRGPSRPGSGFRENVRGDLLLRSRSAVCAPDEGAATGRRFRVREAWSRACGRKKCLRLPHTGPGPGRLSLCVALPSQAQCMPPPLPPRPQLPNSPPPFSSLAFPPQHLSFAANASALRAILLSGFSVADFHVLFPSLSGECFFILFYLFLIVVK